ERRLLSIYEDLSSVIKKLQPKVLVVEKIFFAKNAVSALKLGQARGAAVLTGAIHGLEFYEYSPNEVKQVVVGQGHADKEQVARMVRILTGCPGFSTFDASDALALAICHAHSAGISSRSIGAHQALQESIRQHKKKRLTMAEAVASSMSVTGARKIR
ncbi:MAG: crossover junction endodeoxyribonuclease RuvC, partial [Bdellovibrionota bacterium]